MFGLSLMSLAVGFVAGGVVCVLVPKVYAWFKGSVAAGETVANTVSSVANTVSKL